VIECDDKRELLNSSLARADDDPTLIEMAKPTLVES
jgi:hypothetical protein